MLQQNKYSGRVTFMELTYRKSDIIDVVIAVDKYRYSMYNNS